MNIRKIIVIPAVLCILFVAGCGTDDNAMNKESDNQSSTGQQETEAIVEEHYHDGYTWTQVNKSVSVFGSRHIPGLLEETVYGRLKVHLAPLFEDEDITRIDYHIEDGNGYFMDKHDFMSMDEDKMRTMAESLTEWTENGYSCTLEEQQDVFFTIYYKHDINLERQQELSLIRNLIRKVAIVIDLKYADGSEKQHRYAFDFPYDFNYTNVNIYELTKE